MTWLSIMYVMIGGAIGSMCRYVSMSLINSMNKSFPYGTFVVNISGSFIMGAWIAAMAYIMPSKAKDLHLLFAVGVLGGFTTFSSFSVDAFLLLEKGLYAQTAIYIGGSVILSIVGLMAGMFLVRLAF